MRALRSSPLQRGESSQKTDHCGGGATTTACTFIIQHHSTGCKRGHCVKRNAHKDHNRKGLSPLVGKLVGTDKKDGVSCACQNDGNAVCIVLGARGGI